MLQIFGLTSGLLSALAYIPYVKDILEHKTKPARASWGIWLALGMIAFFSQLAKGATNSLWLTAIQAVAGVILVFLLSLKFGVGGLTRGNFLVVTAASIGLVLWYFASEPALALLINIAIGTIGGSVTVVKAYQDPGSETLSSWLLFGTAGVFAMLAVGKFDFILLVYPFYIASISYAVPLAMILGKRKLHI